MSNSSTTNLKSNKINYNDLVNETLSTTNFSNSPSTYWNELSKICLNTAQNFHPKTNTVTARFNNTEISDLSEKQKDLRLQIETCQNTEKRKQLKTQRNKIIKQQHSLVKSAHEQKLIDV